MTAISVTRHPHGPRLHVLGARIHHGPPGALIAAAGAALRKPLLIVLGAAIAASDAHDFPWLADR